MLAEQLKDGFKDLKCSQMWGEKLTFFQLTGPQFVVPTHCCHPLLSLNGSVSQERKLGKEGTQMKAGVTWK